MTIFVSQGRDPAEIEKEKSFAGYSNTVQSLSSEARLANLELINNNENWMVVFSENGFDPDIYTYYADFSNEEITILGVEFAVNATPKDSRATVTAPASFTFTDIGSVLEITVTAQDGTTKTYRFLDYPED